MTAGARSVFVLGALCITLTLGACAKSDGTAPTSSASSQAISGASASTAPSPAVTFLGMHYASQGHRHFAQGESTTFDYNSDPPTSGPHKEVFTDVFDSPTPLPKYIQVHLLEHGNVLLQYSCKCPDIVGELYQIAYRYDSVLIPASQLQAMPADVQRGEEAGAAVIVAPYPDMKHKIALTAWTRLGTLDAVDQAKIRSFIDAYLRNASNASQ